MPDATPVMSDLSFESPAHDPPTLHWLLLKHVQEHQQRAVEQSR
jgi:hypothetical protein